MAPQSSKTEPAADTPRPRRVWPWSAGAALTCAITALVFFPARHLGFVNWDDPGNFVDNPHFRGLGGEHFRWFITTTHMGHYQPLNWLTFGLDYALWGLDAHRFHHTQVALHAITAVLVFLLTARLLRLAGPPGEPDPLFTTAFAACTGALVFSLHPLRVESVAWLSARTDILATMFCAAAVLLYAGGARRPPGQSQIVVRMNWVRLSGVGLFYLLAMLSKIAALTLPAVLLVLDVFPLRRLPVDPRAWISPRHRRALLEKLPLFGIAAAGAVSAFAAAGGAVASMSEHGLSKRLATVPVAMAFYLVKTAWPSGLSALYEFPARFGPSHRLCLASTAAMGVAFAAVVLLRRRWPGLAAAAMCYAILLMPMSGLTQRGPQMTADRYSYLACVPWAILLGGTVAAAGRRRPVVTAAACVAVLVSLAWKARARIPVWGDSVALWREAIFVDPGNASAHAFLGEALGREGRLDEGIAALRRSLALRPSQVDAQYNLAVLLRRKGDAAAAREAYLADLRANPRRAEAWYGLGMVLEQLDQPAEAAAAYAAALRIHPALGDGNLQLAKLLVLWVYDAEAEPLLRRILAERPDSALGWHLLADVHAAAGRRPESIDALDRAIEAGQRRGETEAVHVMMEKRRRLISSSTASQPASVLPPTDAARSPADERPP